MKRQTSENYYKMRRIYLSLSLPYLTHFYMGTISCTKHIGTRFLTRSMFSSDVLGRPLPPLSYCPCLHKFLAPCTNWRWISSILSSEIWLSLQIRFGFNKPLYTLCLLLRSSHFVRSSFNSILFINRIPKMQCDKNLDNHWVNRTNLTNVSHQLPL